MKKIQRAGLSAAIFAILLSVCLGFAGWILGLTFDNICLEIKEQYCYSEAEEIVGEIENGIQFGKSLEKYYDMDRILKQLKTLIPGNAEAAIVDQSGVPVISSFQGKEVEREYLARFCSHEYRKQNGPQRNFGDMKSMVLPIKDSNQSTIGEAVLIYNSKMLLPTHNTGWIFKIILVLIFIAIIFYLLLEKQTIVRKDRALKIAHIFPMAMVMIGLFLEITILYTDYQKQYENLIYENASAFTRITENKVSELLNKGLPEERLQDIHAYFEKKTTANDTIWNIRIVHEYMDTADVLKRTDRDTLVCPIEANKNLDILVTLNRSFIGTQMTRMTATFAVIFIICLMISYEVIRLIDILQLRMREKETEQVQITNIQHCVSLNIKLLSFLTYTAIYTSMPFAAVVLRTWNASIFGLSLEASASLPLSMELIGILLFSIIIPKVCKKTSIYILGIAAFVCLIAGNLGSAMVDNAYMLLLMRGVCSLGFALFKYLMNTVVATGSATSQAVGHNFALFNAGLLGGITAGGAVGAVVADGMGYQFNYTFTTVLLLLTFIVLLFILPWKYLKNCRVKAVTEAKKSAMSLRNILLNREVLKVLLLGAVPLNIGLMYVVAFLPVYMNFIGESPLAISYAYLINGLFGVYIGVFLTKALRFLSHKAGFIFSILLGGMGILVLCIGHELGMVLISAAIMGLFDGYGTSRITT
ncbi:MAG: MFS transporter, partial [Lachnospiraceae bacterium]